MARTDHEARNRKERARKQGTVRATADLDDGSGESRTQRLERELRATLQGSYEHVHGAYRGLSAADRAAQYRVFQGRVREVTERERISSQPRYRSLFAPVFEGCEHGAMGALRAIRDEPAPRAAGSRPRSRGVPSRTADPSAAASPRRRKRRNSPPNTEPAGRPELQLRACWRRNAWIVTWSSDEQPRSWRLKLRNASGETVQSATLLAEVVAYRIDPARFPTASEVTLTGIGTGRSGSARIPRPTAETTR